MLTTTLKRTLATALSGAAVAGLAGAPAASATPYLPTVPVGASGDPGTTEIVAPSVSEATPQGGLDVSSAVIGAAAGSGLVIVIVAGGLASRRPLTRPRGPARA